MIPVAAGKLRHRVAIEAPSTERSSYGRSVDDWCKVAGAWADLIPLTGTEAEDARQYHATATTKILLRHRRGIELTTKHRITFRGRAYHIGFILNHDELNHTWEVLASELKT